MENNCTTGCQTGCPSQCLIALEQLKKEVAEFYSEYQTKELAQNQTLADAVNFVKVNLSNSVRELLDAMKLTGELDEIIENAITGYIDDITDDFILGCFFDESDNNKINFYVTKDGVHLNKLDIDCEIYGRDPSITYYNGKFYLAITDYEDEHDFSIYESCNLKTWIKYPICANLKDSTSEYNKIWAPDFFIDNNQLYIFITKQYGPDETQGGEGWGMFDIYKLKCTNINLLSFTNMGKVDLSESPHRNHIDANVIKHNNLYYMFVKNDGYGRKELECFTSSDLTEWHIKTNLNWNLDNFVEGSSICKLNEVYYMIMDRYAYPNTKQIITKSKDLLTFTPTVETVKLGTEKYRHGSIIACECKCLKSIIAKIPGFGFSENGLYKDDYNKPKVMIYGSEIENNLNKFFKLFTVKFNTRYKNFSTIFRLTDVQQNKFDNIYQLNLRYGDGALISSTFKSITNSNNLLDNDLYVINTGTAEYTLYMKASITNATTCLDVISYTNFNESFLLGNTKPIETIDITNAIKPIKYNDYLSAGTPISNISLNSLVTPGVWYAPTTTESSTITNKPSKIIAGFRVENKSTNGGIIIQTIYEHSDNLVIFSRYYDNLTNTWYEWKQHEFENDYLKLGTAISNINLNNLKDAGVWYAFSGVESATIQNKPTGVTSGFRVENKSTNGLNIYQVLYEHNDNLGIYIRYYNGSTWYDWKKVAFLTDIPTE